MSAACFCFLLPIRVQIQARSGPAGDTSVLFPCLLVSNCLPERPQPRPPRPGPVRSGPGGAGRGHFCQAPLPPLPACLPACLPRGVSSSRPGLFFLSCSCSFLAQTRLPVSFSVSHITCSPSRSRSLPLHYSNRSPQHLSFYLNRSAAPQPLFRFVLAAAKPNSQTRAGPGWAGAEAPFSPFLNHTITDYLLHSPPALVPLPSSLSLRS